MTQTCSITVLVAIGISLYHDLRILTLYKKTNFRLLPFFFSSSQVNIGKKKKDMRQILASEEKCKKCFQSVGGYSLAEFLHFFLKCLLPMSESTC